MEKCTIREKVYIDTFSGLLKGIVLDFDYKIVNGLINPLDLKITVKITSKNNPAYKCGEIITSTSLWVIPRRMYHKTGIFTFCVYPDYIWTKELKG